VEIRIDDNGEVLYRSPGVFLGYYKDRRRRRDQDADGFVRSGDAGLLRRNGHLKIIDRRQGRGQDADGSLFPPKYVENKLKFYPNIKEAVAFGDGRELRRLLHQHRPRRGRHLGRAQQRDLRLLPGARGPSPRLRHGARARVTR
jgi:long-subunit acyl-CoA synthetase (AMP-forming)